SRHQRRRARRARFFGARRALLRLAGRAFLRATFLRATFFFAAFRLADFFFAAFFGLAAFFFAAGLAARADLAAAVALDVAAGLAAAGFWPVRGASCTANAPPCGSIMSAIQLPPGTSMGPCSSRPPAPLAAATALAESATCT